MDSHRHQPQQSVKKTVNPSSSPSQTSSIPTTIPTTKAPEAAVSVNPSLSPLPTSISSLSPIDTPDIVPKSEGNLNNAETLAQISLDKDTSSSTFPDTPSSAFPMLLISLALVMVW